MKFKEYCKDIIDWLKGDEIEFPSKEYVTFIEMHPDGAKEVTEEECSKNQ